MELVKIGLAVISLGIVGYGFYCLYKVMETIKTNGTTIDAETHDLEQLSNN